MALLRKLLAITLLAFFGLPFASALSALTPKNEANLPACCKRNGKHHCMMGSQGSETASGEHRFTHPEEKCPYAPATSAAGHYPIAFGLPSTQILFSGPIGTPAAIAQAESMCRVARDRSRQKRGPPAVL